MTISSPAMRLLERYSWPGNVRELEHTIERAVALEPTEMIQAERLPEQITSYNPARISSTFNFPPTALTSRRTSINSKRLIYWKPWSAQKETKPTRRSC